MLVSSFLSTAIFTICLFLKNSGFRGQVLECAEAKLLVTLSAYMPKNTYTPLMQLWKEANKYVFSPFVKSFTERCESGHIGVLNITVCWTGCFVLVLYCGRCFKGSDLEGSNWVIRLKKQQQQVLTTACLSTDKMIKFVQGHINKILRGWRSSNVLNLNL